MSCEICGRGNCVASFHSIEEQQSFDDIADNIKERAIRIISDKVGRNVEGFHQMVDGKELYLVDLDKVIEEIEGVDL